MAFLEVAGGIVLGFALSTIGGLVVRRDERRHQRREKVRDRELDAVAVLDDALRQAQWKLPTFSPTDESKQAIFDAHDVWQDGWFRAGRLLRDEDLLDRYRTAGWVLMTALLDEQRGQSADTWIVVRAISNARAGFAAFVHDEPLPAATFPSREEARRLTKVGRDGHDFSAMHEWLEQHPDPNDSR